MKFKSNIVGWLKLKIYNENTEAASISMDGIGHFIPGSANGCKGLLKISEWKIGKSCVIKNQCGWVLAIETA